MTQFALLIAFTLLVVGCTTTPKNLSQPADRTIAYVEQAPGNLTAATFAKGKDRYYVSIRDFKAGAPDNITPIQPQEFEQLWLSLQHPEILAYQFSPDNSDNMANPSYFTIKRLDGQSETNFRIPVEQQTDTAKKLVQTIQLILLERS